MDIILICAGITVTRQYVPLSRRTHIAGSNIVATRRQPITATTGNSPSIFRFETFMTMKKLFLLQNIIHTNFA